MTRLSLHCNTVVFKLYYLDTTASDSGRTPALQEDDLMDCKEFPLVWTRERGYVSLSCVE